MDSRERALRLHAAAAVAREAGEIAQARFADRGSFTVGFKGPQDFLTEVDGETERFIFGRLHALFPDDGFVGEEGAGREPQNGAPTWVVDPIDGTANFARGIPHYCVSIGLVLGTTGEVGVIYDPAMRELFSAARGGGAQLNGRAIRVTANATLATAAVEVGYNMRSGPQSFLGMMRRVTEAGGFPMRCGSGALALAYVAAGRTDAFIEAHINSWDCVAGNVLVVEAGGYVNDFLARDGLHKGNALLACTPALREPLSAIAAAEGVVL